MPRPHRDRPGEEVHIILVGWELDRGVLPFQRELEGSGRMKADRIYLVVPDPEGSKGFHDRMKKELSKVARVEMRPITRKDETGKHVEFDEVVAEVSRLCAKEIAAGNRIHINLSAGSKIAAFAAGLAGMAYITKDAGTIYYVEPERYADQEACEHCGKEPTKSAPLSSGMKDIRVFEPVTLNLPDRTLMDVLGFLASKGPGARVPAMRVLQEVQRLGHREFQGVEVIVGTRGSLTIKENPQAWRMKLLRKVIQPLEQSGFIETGKERRETRIWLTDRGTTYARFAPRLG